MFYVWLLLKKLALPHILPLVLLLVWMILGYISHMFLGDDNFIEQVSEKELKDRFHIDVEFSEKPLAVIVKKEEAK